MFSFALALIWSCRVSLILLDIMSQFVKTSTMMCGNEEKNYYIPLQKVFLLISTTHAILVDRFLLKKSSRFQIFTESSIPSKNIRSFGAKVHLFEVETKRPTSYHHVNGFVTSCCFIGNSHTQNISNFRRNSFKDNSWTTTN